MKIAPLVLVLFLALVGSPLRAAGEEHPPLAISFENLPAPPAFSPGSITAGAGGVIVMGGGERAEIDVLPAEPGAKWITLPWKDAPAFAATASGPVGGKETLFVAGGTRAGAVTPDVFQVSIIKGADGWSADIRALPPLPVALQMAGAGVVANFLFVAGGLDAGNQASDGLYRLDLTKTDAGWKELKLPGGPRVAPVMASRRDEIALRETLWILGGWQPVAGGFTPALSVSQHLPEVPGSAARWKELKPSPEGVVIRSAAPIGPTHLLVNGFTVPAPPVPADALGNAARESDPQLMIFHIVTDSWKTLPATSVFANARIFPLGTDFAVVANTPSAGGFQPSAGKGKLAYTKRHFMWLDYAVLIAYLGAMGLIGVYFSRKEKNTEDYFLGGRKIPWWAAGLSIYATGVSAISFMAIPAKTYGTNWLYIGMGIFPVFTTIIAAYLFIPILRRLNLTTAMEYFELRFNKVVRTIMSVIAIIGQVAGRMSVTLLLPSLALSTVTGWSVWLCVIVMGVIATAYTVMGGIEAVIWTDVIQVVVLFGGAILAFIVIMFNVDGGLFGVINLAAENGKFEAFDWRWDVTGPTMLVMVIWAVSDVFSKGLGQEGLQRAFSTPDVRSAQRSMLTSACISIPGTIIFFGIGTALWAYYKTHGGDLDPTIPTDSIFPLFIAQKLPVGLSGLAIAGLFAAAMSTLDTSMNTVATIVVRDWFAAFQKETNEHTQLVVAKIVTLLCGIFGTAMALYMARNANIGSLWDWFGQAMALIGGGLGGLGFLALCTTRAHTAGVLAGAAVTTGFVVWLKFYSGTPVHFFTYGTACLFVGAVSGYVFSLLIPNPRPKDLTGLTIWTVRKA